MQGKIEPINTDDFVGMLTDDLIRALSAKLNEVIEVLNKEA